MSAARPDLRKPTEVELSVDAVEAAEPKVQVGETLKLAVDPSLTWSVAIGLGDQIGADLEASEGGWTLKAMTRIGRGEFLNPGDSPTLDLGSPSAKVLG